MVVSIYGLDCGSTRKARQWMEANDIQYVERNVLENPLTVSELQSILRLAENGTDEIIATRSKIYKDLNLDIDRLSLQQLLAIIHQYPRLLRSPIIIDEKRFLAGYNKEDIRQFLPRKKRLQWRLNNTNILEA